MKYYEGVPTSNILLISLSIILLAILMIPTEKFLDMDDMNFNQTARRDNQTNHIDNSVANQPQRRHNMFVSVSDER